MFTILLLCAYMCGFAFVLGFMPLEIEQRPTLEGLGIESTGKKKKRDPLKALGKLALFNKPLVRGGLRDRISKDLVIAHINISPEEFFLIKEITIVLVMFVTYPMVTADFLLFWVLICLATGYMLPEFWLKGKIKNVKQTIIRELPDAIDLLALCVNAGLDFMLALKWVVEKSPKSVMVDELNQILQEINVGKTRRDAIKSFSRRYDIPEVSTFARTLIQADKMGTSVTDALNILSEDMRLSRFRRGEMIALKAPLKMLIPLLLFIFPVVGALVAGPILLDFMENNPFQSLGG